MKRKLYLIDGTALLYRAYFAFIKNPLINSKGQHTSAIFGVVNSFMTLLDKMQAEHVAIAFDRKAPTFRHHDYAEYKANRPPMPEDMRSQVAPVREFFTLIGVPEIGADGYEADDALGTMGARYQGDYDIVYVTSDKDYCQLVNAHATLYDPMKDSHLDIEGVVAKYGIRPKQFIDYLALIGDSSDNIPGVHGIGPKGASGLLNEYGDLDSIYANLEHISPNLRAKLEANRDNAYLSRHLATIVQDAQLEIPPPTSLSFAAESLMQALPMLKDYELMSVVRRLEAKYPHLKHAPVAQDYIQEDIFAESEVSPEPAVEPAQEPQLQALGFEAILVDSQHLQHLLSAISASPMVSLDTETDNIDALQASLVGISLCFADDRAYYLPLGHQLAENLPLKPTLAALATALQGKTIIGHNLKYDLTVLDKHGWMITNPIFDTMLAAYILEPGIYSYSLDECARRELNHKMIPIHELIGKGKNQITFDLVAPQKACNYAAEDAWAAWRLQQVYTSRLEHSPARDVFYQIELPLVNVLKRMEISGVSIDTRILGDISHHINLELKKLTEQIYAIAGYSFNINSTQQLAKLLFEDLKLPAKKKTQTGYSTDSSVLETLSEDYEIAELLLSYRMLAKLETTYVSALPRLINPHSGRIHSSFNQCVASTGRLSSSNPNLQNIPIRTELGREIRKAFVAGAEDRLILAADYSQIELRLLALMSRDEVLIQAFRDNVDIHTQTAAQINSIPISAVTPDQRRAAKTINFGILYGMGQRKLARELGISTTDAKQIIERYFNQFPSIRSFIAGCVERAQYEMQAQTIFGRILQLPGIRSKHQGIRSEAERVAVNMPIQGSAADIIKRAMLDLDQHCNEHLMMILQVHDELVFEVSRDYVDEARILIAGCMEAALPVQMREIVALKTDIGVGKSWYEAH
ncbi:MAG TPA: DNA polymerase I [Candidatus Cloacimonadota bacterium]|nr:DNA polymerase I [Candidatus Cloacimonadota bacterium]